MSGLAAEARRRKDVLMNDRTDSQLMQQVPREIIAEVFAHAHLPRFETTRDNTKDNMIAVQNKFNCNVCGFVEGTLTKLLWIVSKLTTVQWKAGGNINVVDVEENDVV